MLLAEALSKGKRPPSGVVNWYVEEHDRFMRSSHLAKDYYLGLRDDALRAAIADCDGKWQANKVADFINSLKIFKKSLWPKHCHLNIPSSKWPNKEKQLFYAVMYEGKSGKPIPGHRMLLNIAGPVVKEKKQKSLTLLDKINNAWLLTNSR